MTRVVIDRELCMSAGVCEMQAPEVFELDAEGVVQVIGEPSDLAAVEDAVAACPTGALGLAD